MLCWLLIWGQGLRGGVNALLVVDLSQGHRVVVNALLVFDLESRAQGGRQCFDTFATGMTVALKPCVTTGVASGFTCPSFDPMKSCSSDAVSCTVIVISTRKATSVIAANILTYTIIYQLIATSTSESISLSFIIVGTWHDTLSCIV